MRAWVTPKGELYYATRRKVFADKQAPERTSREHEWRGGRWRLPVDIEQRRAEEVIARVDPLVLDVLYQIERDKRGPGGRLASATSRAQYLDALIELIKETP